MISSDRPTDPWKPRESGRATAPPPEGIGAYEEALAALRTAHERATVPAPPDYDATELLEVGAGAPVVAAVSEGGRARRRADRSPTGRGRLGVVIAVIGAVSFGVAAAAAVAPRLLEHASAAPETDAVSSHAAPRSVAAPVLVTEEPDGVRAETNDPARPSAARGPRRAQRAATGPGASAEEAGRPPNAAATARGGAAPEAPAAVRADGVETVGARSGSGPSPSAGSSPTASSSRGDRAAPPSVPPSRERPPRESAARSWASAQLGLRRRNGGHRAIETGPGAERPVAAPDASPRRDAPPLDANAVRRVVEAGRPRLQRCYATALRRVGTPVDLRAELTVEIGTDGYVDDVRLSAPVLPGMERCLRRTAIHWTFPESRDGGRVPIPLSFHPVD